MGSQFSFLFPFLITDNFRFLFLLFFEPVLCLQVHLRIEITVIDDHCVGSWQTYPLAPRPCTVLKTKIRQLLCRQLADLSPGPPTLCFFLKRKEKDRFEKSKDERKREKTSVKAREPSPWPSDLVLSWGGKEKTGKEGGGEEGGGEEGGKQ